MKTIICGPPHSGKSVFISNLIKTLPSGYYVRINANGDGEGTWSNNPNQKDVMNTRVKGTNSEADFRHWKRQIEHATQDIVIVDIGGRLQDDKGPLFDACDTFVVVSNNEQMIDEWIAFGISHGCTCVGTVLSTLGDLHESVIEYDPYVRGEMSGLERGHDIDGSKVLRAIADKIVCLSGFKGYIKQGGHDVIDMYDVGIKLGMSRRWKAGNGVEVHNVWYQPEKAVMLHEYITSLYREEFSYRIYGARALWSSCLVALCLDDNNISDIEVYGIISKKYISTSKLATGVEVNGKLSVLVKENDEFVVLNVVLPRFFSPKDCADIVLPLLDPKKKLLLSGKIPSWLAISILMSYDNDEKYVHAPGIGYIKVEDRLFHNYGEIITDYSK